MTKAAKYENLINELDAEEQEYETAIDDKDYQTMEVIERKVVGQTRWSVIKTEVVKFDDDSYLKISYKEPATEMQDCYPDFKAFEVVPQEVTVTEYVRK